MECIKKKIILGGESKSLDGKTCSLYHSHSAKGSQQQVYYYIFVV